jgi:hypothetical protein
MAIKVNGVDMKDAVIKTEQFEMKLLELTPERLRTSVRDISGDSFNFVPRFVSMAYPDRTVNGKDTGTIVVRSRATIEPVILFEQKLVIERFSEMELRYARRKLASIAIE